MFGVEESPDEKRCPKCEAALSSEATFCVKCGTNLKTGEKVPAVVEDQSVKTTAEGEVHPEQKRGNWADFMCQWRWPNAYIIGSILLIISVGVMITTFPHGGTYYILFPNLVPVFGVPFAIIFIIVQYGLLILLRSYKGIALACALLILGMLIGWFGAGLVAKYGDMAAAGGSYARQIICSGACISAAGLGIAFLRDWI